MMKAFWWVWNNLDPEMEEPSKLDFKILKAFMQSDNMLTVITRNS